MPFPNLKFLFRSLMFGRFVGLMMSFPSLLLAQTGLKTPSQAGPSDLVLLKKYDSLAWVYYRSTEADNLFFALQKGEALAHKMNDEHYLGIFYFHKCLYLKIKQQSDSALIYADKALPILRRFSEWERISRILYIQSTIYLDKNEPAKTVQNLIELIKINEKHNLPSSTGNAYQLLAYTFHRLNDTLNQRKYLFKHLELAERGNSDFEKLYAFEAWGKFLTLQKHYHHAHAYLVKAKQLAEHQKNDYAIAEILHDIGDNFTAQKEYLKGLRSFRLAEKIVLKHVNINEPGWDKVLATTYNRTSSLHLSMEKPKEALDYAFRAFDLVNGKTDAHEFLVPALENRIAAQKALGQYRNALNSYEQLRGILQAVDINKDRETAKNMEAKYQLDKIQKEKELYQKNLEIKELALQNEQKQSRFLELMIIFLTLMVAGGVWLFRKNQLYNERISRKNQQLELLNETKDKLFSIIGHDLRAPVSTLPSHYGTLNEKGTGLGLLVCAELVKMNQGTVRACFSELTGTTLELSFPHPSTLPQAVF